MITMLDENSVLGNVLGHCNSPSLINRGEELAGSGFSAKFRNGCFRAGIQILLQRLSCCQQTLHVENCCCDK